MTSALDSELTVIRLVVVVCSLICPSPTRPLSLRARLGYSKILTSSGGTLICVERFDFIEILSIASDAGKDLKDCRYFSIVAA